MQTNTQILVANAVPAAGIMDNGPEPIRVKPMEIAWHPVFQFMLQNLF